MFRPDDDTSTGNRSGRAAVIGASLTINGDVTGEEDLVVEGRLQGQIDLPGHQLTVAPGGRVRAQVRARVIVVEGELQGNVKAEKQAVVRSQGRMQGDIESPAVVLEDGCLFRGNINMAPEGHRAAEPAAGSKGAGDAAVGAAAVPASAPASPEASASPAATAPEPVAAEPTAAETSAAETSAGEPAAASASPGGGMPPGGGGTRPGDERYGGASPGDHRRRHRTRGR